MAYHDKNYESAPLLKEISDAFATLQNYQHLLQQNQTSLATANQAAFGYGHFLSTSIGQQDMSQQNFMQSQPLDQRLQNMTASDLLRLTSGSEHLQTHFAARELSSNVQSGKVRDNFLSELANSMRLANSNLSASAGLGRESSYKNLQKGHLGRGRTTNNLLEISSASTSSINADDEDTFLYGSEEDKLPLSSRFPQYQHAPDKCGRELELSHSYAVGDQLPIKLTPVSTAGKASQQGNVLHDILQSLGFDFEKSRQNQEKAKMREEVFTVKETETFLGGNVNFKIDRIPQVTPLPKQTISTKNQQREHRHSAIAPKYSAEKYGTAGKMQACDVPQREKLYQKIVETLTTASEALLSKKMKLQLCMVSDEDRTRKSKAIKRGRSIEQFRECKTALFSLYTLHQEMVKVPVISRDDKLMNFLKQITVLMRQLTDRLRLLEDNVEKIGSLLGLPDSLVGLYNMDSQFVKENKVIQTLILQSRQARVAKSQVDKPPAETDLERSECSARSPYPEKELDQPELLKLPLALLGASKYWCKPCTAILRSVKELLKHLHDGQHYENTNEYFQPWLPTCAKTNIPVVAVKGRVENVHCQLCQLDVKEPERPEEHIESQYHRILCEKFVIECLCTDQVVSAKKSRQDKSAKFNRSKSRSQSPGCRSKLSESHGRCHSTEHRSPSHSYSQGWHEPELQRDHRSCSPVQPAHHTYKHDSSPLQVSQVDDHLRKSPCENVRWDMHPSDISYGRDYNGLFDERHLSSAEQYRSYGNLVANEDSYHNLSPVTGYRQADRQSSFTSREEKLPYKYRGSAYTNYADSDSISHRRHRTSPENDGCSSLSKSCDVRRLSKDRSRSRGRFRSHSKSRDLQTCPVEKRLRERSRSLHRSLERHQRLRSRSRHRCSRSNSSGVSRSFHQCRRSISDKKQNQSRLHSRHNRSRSRRRHHSRSREPQRRPRSGGAERHYRSRSRETERRRHSRSREPRRPSKSRRAERHYRSKSGEVKQQLQSRSHDDKRHYRSRSRENERQKSDSKSAEVEQRQPSKSRETEQYFRKGNNIQTPIEEKSTQARTEEKSEAEARVKETETIEAAEVPDTDGEMNNNEKTVRQKGDYIKDGKSTAHLAARSNESHEALENRNVPLHNEVSLNNEAMKADNQMSKADELVSIEQLALESKMKCEQNQEVKHVPKACEEVSDEELIVVDKSEEEIIGESCEVISDKELSSENEVDIMRNESEMISDEDLDTELNSDAVLEHGEFISDDDMSGGELLFEEVSDEECPESCEEISDEELPVDSNTRAEKYDSVNNERLYPDLKVCKTVIKDLITKVIKMTETGIKLKQKRTRSQLSKKHKIKRLEDKTFQRVKAVNSQNDNRKVILENNSGKEQQPDSVIDAELEFVESPDLAMLMELADGEELIDIDELHISDEENRNYTDETQVKITERNRHVSDKHKSVHKDRSSRSKYCHTANKTSSSHSNREKSKSSCKSKTKNREKYEEPQDLREYLDSRTATQQRIQDITEKIRSEPNFDKRIVLRKERSRIAKELEERVKALEKREQRQRERLAGHEGEENERKLHREAEDKERKLRKVSEGKERKLRREAEEKETKLRREAEEKERRKREEKRRALEREEKEKQLRQEKMRKTVAQLRNIYGKDVPVSELPPGMVPYLDIPSAKTRENTIKCEELRRSQDLEMIRYLEEKRLQSYLDLDLDLWLLRTGPLLSCAKGEATRYIVPEDDNGLQPPGVFQPLPPPPQPIFSFVAPPRPLFSIAPPPPFGLLGRFTRDRSLVHIQTKP